MRKKYHITAYQNGVCLGYVKQVSYSRNKFTLTNDISQAKGYASDDHVQGEIDFLTSVGFAYGYVFCYG